MLGSAAKVRYTDMDIDKSGAQDFVIRRRTPTVIQLFIIFVLVFFMALSISMTVIDRQQMLAILTLFLMITGWYVVLVIQRNRDLTLTTEFQNALFASALGINNKFCLIIRRDGNIFYLDRSFQETFSEFLRQPQRTIDTLLEYGHVSEADRKNIYNALDKGTYSKVIFDIRGSSGSEFQKMVVSIEPITRPSGFILLRGRAFVEDRGVNDPMPSSSMFNRSSVTLFSHVMDTMNMGMYMTDPQGNLIYANSVMEHWLNFNDGEIASSSIGLKDIIYHPGKSDDDIMPDNYEGEIMLQKKTGGIMKAFVNQKIIRDEMGRPMGCTALVHSFTEQDDPSKKKQW